ncbi:DUF6768 family protein [Flagellimonas pacifica]|uniref:Uncharacterized protein n=1 Tax=Flagellimonas pacifica TaxID=1247520 RepID=A0A285MQD6_9FLAO|nr:DUF6768 family protein [Allomuricauda parva]SNY99380.1 hypothetical protein SAMN06265377_1185 [Allomuricauda parva]
MKTNMEDIDRLIKDALTEEEAKFYDGLDEQNLFQMLGGLFKGKNSWLALIMNVMNALVFGLLIYCIIQTFDVENTNDLILWVGGVLVCFSTISMLKIYMWMQMHRNALMREIKRLELLISAQAQKK